MVLYFEPQILYGMTGPNIAEMSSLLGSGRQILHGSLLPTLLYSGFIKGHHTAMRGNQKEKQSLNRATVFLIIHNQDECLKQAILERMECDTVIRYALQFVFNLLNR